MSIFFNVTAACASCGRECELELAASVAADRRPDLRQEILDGTFQAETCAGCGTRLRLPPHLSYLDFDRGQWILAEGIDQLADWRTVEDYAAALFERSYGKGATPVARELGSALRPRLVFGWAALRETLITDDLGLDPVTLELLKIALMRTVPDPPIGDLTELRLIGGGAADLRFAWVDCVSEHHLAMLSAGRDLHDDIATNPAPWTALRSDLEGRMFCDLRRLIFA